MQRINREKWERKALNINNIGCIIISILLQWLLLVLLVWTRGADALLSLVAVLIITVMRAKVSIAIIIITTIDKTHT